MLNAWYLHKKKLCPSESPLRSVTQMENYPINLKVFKKVFRDKQVIRLKDWIDKMRGKEQMNEVLQVRDISWFNFIQLKKWTDTWLKKNNKCREYTKYEQHLLLYEDTQSEMIVKGIVSKLYKIISDLDDNRGGLGSKLMWEQDIKKEIREEDWAKMWRMRILRSLSVRIKGNFFKISLRWYMTPVKLNKMNVNFSKLCWKCDNEIGTFYHLCGNVKRYRNFGNVSLKN